MEITSEQYVELQRYLDGEMTVQEEVVFLDEVEGNAALKESLEFEKQIRESPFLLGMHRDAGRIKNLVEKAGQEWEDEKQKPEAPKSPVVNLKNRRLLYTVLSAAACIILIIVAIVFVKPNGPDKSDTVVVNDSNRTVLPDSSGIVIVPPVDTLRPKQDLAGLFDEYYRKEHASDDSPQYLADALDDYNNNDYRTIQELYVPKIRGSIYEQQSLNEHAAYYKGLSFIETRDYNQAGKQLEWVIDSAENKTLNANAKWYRALLYLKAGNKATAIKLLSSVAANKNALHNRQAIGLLSALEK